MRRRIRREANSIVKRQVKKNILVSNYLTKNINNSFSINASASWSDWDIWGIKKIHTELILGYNEARISEQLVQNASSTEAETDAENFTSNAVVNLTNDDYNFEWITVTENQDCSKFIYNISFLIYLYI